jgi:hypothetical protein
VLDGLAALPLDGRNREQLEWIADEVVEAGGDASIWIGELASPGQELALATAMGAQVAADYARVVSQAKAAESQTAGQRKRTLARLRRELRRIRTRDYFPPPEREIALESVEHLAAVVEELVP